MNSEPLISVIVPVYKVEAYLDKCISSIVNQTYTNLEIILVDDGSPDRSGAICDAWAEKDSRIRVIHQANAGGGAARNAALDIAQGELIGMIDSDDYITPQMYAHLYSLMTPEVDIVECCITETHSDDSPLDDGDTFASATYDVEEAMRLHIENRLFLQTPPNKLYRAQVLKGVRFPAGTGIDDEYWTYRAIGNSRKLVHSSCIMYAYRQQENSVMHTLNTKKRLRAVEAKTLRHEYILKYYPHLGEVSLKNLWFTCFYQGQLVLCSGEQGDRKAALAYLSDTLRKYPVQPWKYALKEMIWLTLAGISFAGTCRLRNLLKIGF